MRLQRIVDLEAFPAVAAAEWQQLGMFQLFVLSQCGRRGVLHAADFAHEGVDVVRLCVLVERRFVRKGSPALFAAVGSFCGIFFSIRILLRNDLQKKQKINKNFLLPFV